MERNRRSSEDTKQLDHAIKSSFMCICLDWVGLYIGYYFMTMIHSVDWLNSK